MNLGGKQKIKISDSTWGKLRNVKMA